ncbi:exosortase [Colwellia demingiae]|uniref:exosortase n=1 Tax=Colwellia demingiae TaxID=89401 RepID=UPI001478F2FB|nr:exosortase [Colwellia demingiae]
MNIKKINSNIFKHNFSPFILILSITILIALLNIPIMQTLWSYSFDDGTYSHAYFIPLIVAYLFYVINNNGELKYRETISLPASVLLIISAYILFVTSTAQISLLYWLAILLLLCSSIIFVFNANIKIASAASYFIFLLPVWGILTIPLQDLSVFAANTLLGFTTIPVFVEEQFVHIPSGIFEIAGGCSGLRYLITSLAISTLFSFLYLRTIKNTATFISVAILGALLTNWLRISILIIIGHQTEMTSDLMTDHNMFGWYLYIPFIFLLFKFGGYLADKENNKPITSDSSAKIQLNTPSWPLAIILFTILLFSSTSLHMSTTTTPETKLIDVLNQPIIYNYSTVEVITNNSNKTQLVYNFSEDNLESKPTFFENNFIPKNWLIIGKVINNEEQVIKIKNGKRTAVITLRYEISGLKIGSSSRFKLERLKQAMFGQTKTKLHWQFQLD